MELTRLSLVPAVLLGLLTIAGAGCTSQGPSLGIFSVPIPVSPYFQDKKEREFHDHERYGRVPVLGPLSAEGPNIAMDPPSDDEVMVALENAKPVSGGIPLLHTIQRNNIRIVKDLVSDYVDPPRVYPLIGPAQLHHAHWKCTVYFTEVTRVGWPIPHTLEDEDSVEVLYIDKNHFHMVGNVDTGVGAGY